MVQEIRRTKLSNGLEIIGEVSPERKSATLGFFVKTGARDEVGAESGVSHFLEHMVFKGTQRRSALDITFEMGNLGAQANAFTSEENTVYYSSVLPEYFTRMQELLSDMLRPALRDDDFNTEKKVILEEIALYEDRPQFFLMDSALNSYFGGHPAGNRVLGTNKSISELPASLMRQYHEKRYSPGNMCLVAAGCFEWQKFVEDAEKLCGGWKTGPAPRIKDDYAAQKKQETFKKKNLNQAHMVLITRGTSAQVLERHSMGVLAHILGDPSGSKLYWELVDKGLVESAGSDVDERDGTGLFIAWASTEPERVPEVSDIVRKVLSKPLTFTADELDRAKTKLASGMVLGGELPMGRFMALGYDWSYRGKPETLQESMANINSVTRESIEDALKKYPLDVLSEFRLLPEE